MRGDMDRPTYEPPELRVLGTLHELTLGFCLFDKSLGSSHSLLLHLSPPPLSAPGLLEKDPDQRLLYP